MKNIYRSVKYRSKGIMDIKEKLISSIKQVTDDKILYQIYTDVLENHDILQRRYSDWFENQSEEIFNLHMKVLEYEEYFYDMCLSKRSYMRKYIESPYVSFREDSESLSLDGFYFRICSANLKECGGTTEIHNRKITIDKQYIHSKPVILHEMLHAHEYIISQVSSILRDLLTLELYKELKRKIEKLDEIIFNHGNIPYNLEMSKSGGNHDVLFPLKSIDLDLKCNFELFTVFGYNYTKIFKDMNLI